jgi:coproporphyrinogen III oxidase-like Fe-S oxidoreductase
VNGAMPEPIRHLYAHVPFCPTICPYCDFHVLERRAGLVDAYLVELEREAARLSGEFPSHLTTIYVGGGTPSFLRDREISRFVQIIRDAFSWVPDFASGGEATLEVNPGTVTRSRAKLWRDLGFDRASLGVQSTQDDVLRFLGRTHDSKQALESLDILLETGFRVSADLITAVPGQDIERDLRALASVGLEHISAYTLTIEHGTPFARQGACRIRPARVRPRALRGQQPRPTGARIPPQHRVLGQPLLVRIGAERHGALPAFLPGSASGRGVGGEGALPASQEPAPPTLARG